MEGRNGTSRRRGSSARTSVAFGTLRRTAPCMPTGMYRAAYFTGALPLFLSLYKRRGGLPSGAEHRKDGPFFYT